MHDDASHMTSTCTAYHTVAMDTAGGRGAGIQVHFTVVTDETRFTGAVKRVTSIGACAPVLTRAGTTLVQVNLTVIALCRERERERDDNQFVLVMVNYSCYTQLQNY